MKKVSIYFIVFLLVVNGLFAQSIDLGNYILKEGPTSIPTVELSGVTYNAETNSLFAVSDNFVITEMSLDGCVLREISLIGFNDTEGIVHLGGDSFAITEERLGQVVKVVINANTSTLSYAAGQVVSLTNSGLPNNANVGLEGLAFSSALNSFYTLKEKTNKTIYSFQEPVNFPTSLLATVPFDINAMNYSVGQTDLAGLAFTKNGNLIMLSQESTSLVEVNPTTGVELSAINLPLTTQIEGIAVDDDNNVYIVAEGATGVSASLLYKYAPQNVDPKIGDFNALSAGGQIQQFILPSTHTFQKIIEEGDPIMGGVLAGKNDFTAYVPIAGSSTKGYLSINHENTIGGVTILDVNYNEVLNKWETTSAEAIDFSGVAGTSRNCSGGITPWGTVVTCEESFSTNDSNSDGYNDLGWAVEIDPKTKTVIDKRWAMGNFQHENAVFHCNRRTAYEGIDASNGFLYKFVADNVADLSSGKLYVYVGPKSGVGSWVLVPNTTIAERNATIANSISLNAQNFFNIEDVEIGPDGWIYFASKVAGTVYRFQDSDPISGTTVLQMESYITGIPGADNLAFDCEGNLWVYQDGGDNHIWMAESGSNIPKIFARLPTGSEPTGITFSPDCKYLFMSIQHPSTSNVANQKDLTGTTVDFNKSITIVISRKPENNIGCSIASVQSTIATGADDVETKPGGPINTTSSDLELTDETNGLVDNQWIGLKFNNIQVPQGAHISNAYIQFTVDEVSVDPTSLSLWSIQSDNLSTLLPSAGSGLEANTLSVSCVPWSDVASWPTVGAAGIDQRSPDIGLIIEEVIERPNWAAGNNLGIVIQGSGRRTAESYDGSPAQAATLVINYEECPISNCDDYGNRFLGPVLPSGTLAVGDYLQMTGSTSASSSQRYTANMIEMKPTTTIISGSILELDIDNCNN